MHPTRPSLRTRLMIACLAAVYGAIWVLWPVLDDPRASSDFDQTWYAARALFAGLDPYTVIGPQGSWFVWDWPLYYPLPGVLLVSPLGLLPLIPARAVFVGLSAALLAYAVTRDGYARLPLFLSASYIMAAKAAQWSPLLAAGVLLPAASWALCAKPNIAIALSPLATRRTIVAAVVAGVAASLIGFVLRPDWVEGWLRNVRSAPHFVPLIAHAAGPLMLAALLRWRRREAWLLLAFAVVPHTPVLYETVPLFLLARTRAESLFLACCSGLAFVAQLTWVTATDTPTYIYRLGDVTLALMYLPALAMVLRHPNTGDLPAFAERAAARLPGWLRGARSPGAAEQPLDGRAA